MFLGKYMQHNNASNMRARSHARSGIARASMHSCTKRFRLLAARDAGKFVEYDMLSACM